MSCSHSCSHMIVYRVGEVSSDGYTSAAFHPDGVLLGTGTLEGRLRILDVKNLVCDLFYSFCMAFFLLTRFHFTDKVKCGRSQSNLVQLDRHVGSLTGMSENGYIVAVSIQY